MLTRTRQGTPIAEFTYDSFFSDINGSTDRLCGRLQGGHTPFSACDRPMAAAEAVARPHSAASVVVAVAACPFG